MSRVMQQNRTNNSILERKKINARNLRYLDVVWVSCTVDFASLDLLAAEYKVFRTQTEGISIRSTAVRESIAEV